MAGKGAQVTVLYPKKEGVTFKLDYYLATHMPLVAKTWTKYGLKSYSVVQNGPDAPFSISTVMEWESSEGIGKAFKDPGTAEVMGDIANFSSEQPVLLTGEVVGRSS